MSQILVADIGGTNARFAIVAPENGAISGCRDVRQFRCADFPDFPTLIATYLGSLGSRPTAACLALAAPIRGPVVRLTNLDLVVDAIDLERRFAFDKVTLVNDFAALALSVLHLGDEDIAPIRMTGEGGAGPVSVMGPGTGFGASLLVPSERGCVMVPTEAGHQTFAPVGDIEIEIAAFMHRRQKHLSVENMMSGSGLCAIHRALAAISGRSPESLTAEAIATAAAQGDASCGETLRTFFAMLGSVAGDLALAHGATGGVFIGGGIVMNNLAFLEQSAFETRFLDKGLMRNYVERIPVAAIRSFEAALIGSAHWYLAQGRMH